MAIVQISKIQHRSGNIVDLPQLDEAELGFASDAKRLFIGKVSPNENIEVLTSYSNIAFDQLDGSFGNLDISAISVEDGQVLTYDGTNWVNRGGDAGGLIDLGDAGNVRITGGAIGYVLETDGTGNLSWTPKSTLVSYIENVSNANPAVVTTEDENIFTDGAQVTFTNLPGAAGSVGYDLNGQTLYANVLTANTFSLYTDSGLTTTYDASGDTAFPYTTATATSATNNRVTVSSSSAFTVGDAIKFIGTTFGVLNSATTYYVKTKPTGTTITLSLESGGTELTLTTASGSCTVYATGGRAIASLGTSGTTLLAAGANTAIQYNLSGTLSGSSDFTWNTSGAVYVMTINGNANVGNLNSSGLVTSSRFISNVATGTAPLTVTSTTRVSNLNVTYSNVSDFGVVTTRTTGTYYPVFVNGSSTANRALSANANLGFDVATGNLSATKFYSNTTIQAVGNIIGDNFESPGNVLAAFLRSNVATGQAPIVVNSTTRVANLNVAYANVADFINTSLVTTGTYYLILANATSGNIAEGANANLTFNAATGALSAVLLGGTLTTAAQPNVTSVGNLTSLTVTGTVTLGNVQKGGTAGDILNITGSGNTNVNGAGGIINITAASGNGTGIGGNLVLTGGSANSSGNAAGGIATVTAGNGYGQGQGGAVGIYSGASANTYGAKGGNVVITGGTYDGAGGAMTLSGGEAAGLNHLGGDITIKAGSSTGSANAGKIVFQTSTPGSSGNTIQVLSNRAIISDTTVNVVMTTAATSTASGALVIGGGLGVAGNVYASAYYGAATGLTAIPGGNVSGAVSSATSATTAGTVTTNAQPNITSTGTLTVLTANSGSLTATAPFLLEQTWNNATIGFTGLRLNITNTNSAAASYLLDLQVGGVSRLNVNKNGVLQTTDITTGGNTTAGNITGNWSLTAGSRLNATYADLAEYYESDINYEPGTVVEFGGEKEITIASDATIRVAGVVSTNPAYIMNSSCPGIALPVALQGRVPVKVRGTIRKGDLLISGGNGYARPTNSPIIGSIIGKALQNFEGIEGIIEVAVGRL